MFDRIKNVSAPLLLVGILFVWPGSHATAEDGAPWRVSKSSGDVWMTTPGVQQASLTSEALLKPGDTIRTGRSGRVLLTRGEETMLISPNSVIALPTDQKDGLSTTIIEQAGSVLIQAEKRNVKHFQVETPYLAAVVKGTQFQVSVTKDGGSVEVREGQVEVADFKTGQFALVLPGQAAKVSARGTGGLALSGAGKFNPIEHGSPRTSPFQRVPVPKGGLAMPSGELNGKTVRALGHIDVAGNDPSASHANNGLRITAPLGEVVLNFVKATDGLAHGAIISPAERNSAAKQTIWNTGELLPGNGASKSYGQGNSNASGNANVGGTGNANGNGNANGAGNGNGNGNGNGAGNAMAVGNGNGNGNGNENENGNGKGKGKGKS